MGFIEFIAENLITLALFLVVVYYLPKLIIMVRTVYRGWQKEAREALTKKLATEQA